VAEAVSSTFPERVGRDASTVERVAVDLENCGGSVTNITEVCADMSPAFTYGIDEHLPVAEMTFDRFQVVKGLSDVVDTVRRSAQKQVPELKGTRHLWLRNRGDISTRQLEELARLNRPRCSPQLHVRTAGVTTSPRFTTNPIRRPPRPISVAGAAERSDYACNH
jgi:transposase